MADKANKVPENAAGQFFVDTECIGCGVCVDTAPENFVMNDDNLAYVFKQPENEGETEQCNEAVDTCPVEAIGTE